jgi:hypothetical protein
LAAGGFRDKTTARHQPADFRTLTIRAGRFFAAEDQTFEFLAALLALIFIDGHEYYSFWTICIKIAIRIGIEIDCDPDSDFDFAVIKLCFDLTEGVYYLQN